jgi:hypothetical protein
MRYVFYVSSSVVFLAVIIKSCCDLIILRYFKAVAEVSILVILEYHY